MPEQVGVNAVRVEPRLLGQFPEDQKGAGTGQRAASGVQKELGAMAGVEVGATACEIAQEPEYELIADFTRQYRHDAGSHTALDRSS